MTSSDRLETLEAEARYHRERLALYRAKVYGGLMTSPTRLQELERASEFAAQRVARFSSSADSATRTAARTPRAGR
jgi:hypothetical protein